MINLNHSHSSLSFVMIWFPSCTTGAPFSFEAMKGSGRKSRLVAGKILHLDGFVAFCDNSLHSIMLSVELSPKNSTFRSNRHNFTGVA